MSNKTSAAAARTRALLDKHAVNINTITFSVTHQANVNGVNADKNIYLFGDSHSWGQGSPEWDYFQGATYSAHSASLFNRGFMERIAGYIRAKCGFDERVYAVTLATAGKRILPADIAHPDQTRSGVDPLNHPVQVVAGRVLTDALPWLPGVSTPKGWYTPFAVNDPTAGELYRDKLYAGRFNTGAIRLAVEDETNFAECGKGEYINLLPLPGVPASGAPWTAVTDSNGTVLAEFDGSSFFIRFNGKTPYAELGFLDVEGQKYFIPGYGVIVTAGNTNIAGGLRVRAYKADGVSYPAGLEKFIHAHMRIYRAPYVQSAVVRIDPQKPFRKLFIAVRKHDAGRKIAVALADQGSLGGVAWNPVGHLASTHSYKLVPQWDFGREGYPVVRLIDTNGNRVDATAWGAKVAADRIELDTYAAAAGDVVFEIDYGSKSHAPVYIQDIGAGGGGTSQYTTIRGVLFDNNQVTNYAMGGHTIGQWMGDGASYNDGARDHLADILSYAKVTPHLVVTQLPLVNEYLRQTPLATFKANIQTFISRISGTLNSGGKKTDFLFFTTLGTKQIEFEGRGSNAISYDDYAKAAREQCIASDVGFLDCRAGLKELVNQGFIDHNRLYAEDNHPGSAANELIAHRVIDALEQIL